jgi:hypothetical protein
MNVTMWEHCTCDRFFDVAKFNTLTLLLLPISCKLIFPVVGLKISSVFTLALRSPKNVHVVLREFIKYMF